VRAGVVLNFQGSSRSVVTTKVMPPQQQDMTVEQPVLPRTKTVSIENLAASTTEQQLKLLCRGIGVLEASQTHFICLNLAIMGQCN